MHVSDGILPLPISLAAHAVSLAAVWWSGRKLESEEVPRTGLLSATVFVASLIHFPLGGTSAHLGLFGLAGVLLGKRAFLAIYTALAFHALLFQHGGLVTLGLNAFNMGAGALLAWQCWRLPRLAPRTRALAAGFVGTAVPGLLVAAQFSLSGYGKGFFAIAALNSMLGVVEALVTAAAVAFVLRARPAILAGETRCAVSSS